MVENLSFVLVETTHAGNIGAAARAMKTMGFSDLRLVRPCKHLSAESLARASGADDLVRNAQLFDSLEEALHDREQVFGTSARSRKLEWSTLELPDAGAAISASTAATAIVFGRERSGLSNEELALCHYRLAIPSNPDFSSLNLASAVQVVSYEVRRSSGFDYKTSSTGPRDLDSRPADTSDTEVSEELAAHEALEHMFEHLEKVSVTSGFLDPSNPRLLMQRFRRLFQRAPMLKSEVQIVRGFLTAVEKYMARSL